MDRRWRFARWLNKQREDGFPVIAFGFRIGYWPCVHGYFISVNFGTHTYDLWHGDASKQRAETKPL